MAEAVGFVVAGGESRRMGADKALLAWGGSTLLDDALGRLRAVSDDVRILSGGQRRYADRGAPVHPDGRSGLGPLGGLATALAVAAPRPVLFLAVDLPFVPVALLEALVARLGGADAVVPVGDSGAEPLCAAYGPACAEAVRAVLDSGERKMTSFWPRVRVATLGGLELSAFGDPARMFRNVNTPDDYGRARDEGGPAAR